jgi:cell division protein FtsA
MQNPEIIVGLDIGTTKIAVIVGKVNQFGKVEVLGMGKAESLGVSRGAVANIDKTVEAIKFAVDQAEKTSGYKITDVCVGIAGQHIKSLQHRGVIPRESQDEVITKEDVNRLKSDMFKLSLPPGDQIIHVLPQEYIVDNEPNIKDPIGMFGFRLEANFHIITGQISAVQNIYRCVQRAGLNVVDIILEPLASSESVLTEDEKEAGVALIDIGGGTTDIAIFHDNIIRHTAVIPLGGNVITEDVKDAFGLMRKHAEQLKVKYGNTYPNSVSDNEYIKIAGLPGRSPKEISSKNLANIIHARVEEIMEYAYSQIRVSGFEKKMAAGIVITGGGSMMQGMKPMIESLTGMEVRLGYPTAHLNKAPINVKHIAVTSNATGVGLIIRGYKEIMNVRSRENGEEAPVLENASEVEVLTENIQPEVMQDNATPLSDYANETNMVAENNADNQLKMRSKIVKWWEKALDKATTWIANGADNDNEFK